MGCGSSVGEREGSPEAANPESPPPTPVQPDPAAAAEHQQEEQADDTQEAEQGVSSTHSIPTVLDICGDDWSQLTGAPLL